MRWSASKLSRGCAHHNVLSELSGPRTNRDKAAVKGQVFHAALEEWHRTGLITYADDDRDVLQWLTAMIDNGWAWPDGAELEVAWGLDVFGCYNAVEETPPGSHVYRSLAGDDLLTAGRADAVWLSEDGRNVVVTDWKTGRYMPDPPSINLQLKAAGLALCQRWAADSYTPCLYLARSGVWQIGEEIHRGTADWDAALENVRVAAELDDKPHPGPQCSTCWERKLCPEATP